MTFQKRVMECSHDTPTYGFKIWVFNHQTDIAMYRFYFIFLQLAIWAQPPHISLISFGSSWSTSEKHGRELEVLFNLSLSISQLQWVPWNFFWRSTTLLLHIIDQSLPLLLQFQFLSPSFSFGNLIKSLLDVPHCFASSFTIFFDF